MPENTGSSDKGKEPLKTPEPPAVPAVSAASFPENIDTVALLKQVADQNEKLSAQINIQAHNQEVLLERLNELERDNIQLRELQGNFDGPSERDSKEYTEVALYAPRIEPGFPVHPPGGVDNKPQLFDLHTEPTHARMIQAGRYKAASEEYRLLYCICFYLSCCTLAIKEEIFDNLPLDQAASVQKHLNSLTECVSWFRKRIAIIRVGHDPAFNSPGDHAFIDFLKSEIYDSANVSFFGSKEITDLATRFSLAKGKHVLNEGAKSSARSAKAPLDLKVPSGETSGKTTGKSSSASGKLHFSDKKQGAWKKGPPQAAPEK